MSFVDHLLTGESFRIVVVTVTLSPTTEPTTIILDRYTYYHRERSFAWAQVCDIGPLFNSPSRRYGPSRRTATTLNWP